MSAATADERLTLMGLFAETWAGLRAMLAAQLAEHGLGEIEFEVLLRLSRSHQGLLRMTDLAAQTSLTSSGVTRVVDRLVTTGRAQRQACTADRRTTYAVITASGRAALADTLPGHLALLERWLTGPLDASARESLAASLRVLRDGVRPCAAAGTEVGTEGTTPAASRHPPAATPPPPPLG